jgi:hypothetical protein
MNCDKCHKYIDTTDRLITYEAGVFCSDECLEDAIFNDDASTKAEICKA